MRFRLGLAASLLVGSGAFTPSHAKISDAVAVKCAKFEQNVKQHASVYQKAMRNTSARPNIEKQANDAKQLAFALSTVFNMTPHNSAYVAQGLCTMQKGRVK